MSTENAIDHMNELRKICQSPLILPNSKWPKEKIDQINKRLQSIYCNPTDQQYLYDRDELVRFIPILQGLYLAGLPLEFESMIVLRKLLSHQTYSDRSIWPTSVQMMLDNFKQVTKSKHDNELTNWYRLFFLDHAISRMYRSEYEDREKIAECRSKMIKQFYKIAGYSNKHKIIANPSFLLRLAHFEGHLGNDCLDQLQKLDVSKNSKIKREIEDAIDRLSKDGLDFFRNAAKLRIQALAFSPTPRIRKLMTDKPDFFAVQTLGSCRASRSDLEKFKSEAQAFADIANQFTCLVCVLCYRILIYKSDSIVTDEFFEACRKATFFWDALRLQLIVEKEAQIYRVIEKRRISEHMLWTLQMACSPKTDP